MYRRYWRKSMKHMVIALSWLLFMSSLSTLRFCFCGPAFSITYDYSIVVSRVRKLLQQRDYIRIAHGLYSQSNYPTCVRSHYHAVTLTGFIHALSYIPREKPVLKHRERIYRKALLKVKSRTPPLLVVKAYKDTLDTSIIKKNDYSNIDHAVSGRYDIYFAQDNCFVAATTIEVNKRPKGNATAAVSTGNSRCLLWRRPAGTSEEHVACKSAFLKICSFYRGHETKYKKEICS
ncbi:uncharacterized protein LOC119179130 isoform X2 [Rhipicephalus microplus]|uniref:uncharacterized protein LOC119179130 isoform X2 n=1 Tax=Rhipicephalus microplus TaxID=6941 RepID=UPI003F6C3DAE